MTPIRVLFVVLALAGPAAFVALTASLLKTSPALPVQAAVHLVYCALAVALVWCALYEEHAPLASIGLRRPSWRTLALAAVVLLVAQFVLPVMTAPIVRALGTAGVEEGVQRLAPLPVWFRVVLALTGGAIEEMLYRGYATERLVAWTGSAWRGGTVAALAFALAHIPAWGVAFALAADLPFGILMTAAYLWRRDLVANILAHSIALTIGLMTMA